MYAIETVHLTKKYKDVTAVEDLNLQIRKGELFSLLGINGAGKTTTVKMLSCLTRPTGGDALVLGHSICKDPAGVKKRIAVSPQETAVAPGLTVEENLKLMCGICGLEKPDTATGEMTELLGLEGVLGKKAGKLSGGWQRRVSIAMALIGKPEVLFLDEPTLGLDVIARSDLWKLIRSLKGEITVVLTTHYMEEAEALSDRVGIMKDGRLLVCDRVQEIKKSTKKDSFEQAFVQIVKGGEQ